MKEVHYTWKRKSSDIRGAFEVVIVSRRDLIAYLNESVYRYLYPGTDDQKIAAFAELHNIKVVNEENVI